MKLVIHSLAAGSMLAAGLLCLGQSPLELFEKAPPHIDEALRARITKFYQAHVDRKLRVADEIVAEDSKEIFFEAEKPRCLAFEIAKINYSENFTKAKALVNCDVDWANPRMGKMRLKAPIWTLWKVVDGEWYWYAENTGRWETPFGQMGDGKDDRSDSPPAPQFKPVTVQDIRAAVRMDKSEIRLSSYEPSSAEAVITNGLPGNVSLRLSYSPQLEGLSITLDRTELKAAEQARVLFSIKPADRAPKPTVAVTISVDPVGQVLPIQLTFAVPPELEKNIPPNVKKP